MQTVTTMENNVAIYENALPQALFDRLLHAVMMIGNERMKSNGSYSTTFWFQRGDAPSNVAEEAVSRFLGIVKPGDDCIGTEWWLGRLGNGKKLGFHYDRDLALQKQTGEIACPLLGSVFYLNDYPSTPTVIVPQTPGHDGKSGDSSSDSVESVANRYMVFRGDLRHGVVPDPEKLHLDPKRPDGTPERRLTLLVNFWNRKPLAPVCNEYDGSIYPSLRESFLTAASDRISTTA
ncbi:MAG: hypothetical protein AB3N20_19695 [Rhizobiaceae bacterium]